MSSQPPPIDEYSLAAFLAGGLPDDRRAQIIEYLAENADARELVCMARVALDAVDEPLDDAPPPDALPSRAHTRAARPHRVASMFGKGSRYALAACILLLVGFGAYLGRSSLQQVFRTPTDTFRDGSTDAPLDAHVTVTPALAFEWPAVPEANSYRLYIFDVEDADLVTRHVTGATRLGPDDAFVRSLDTLLTAGRAYSLRIEALDAQNRILRSSQPKAFEAPQ